jgi:hypothetical protein
VGRRRRSGASAPSGCPEATGVAGEWRGCKCGDDRGGEELSGLGLRKLCCRRAEVSALLRFAGGLHIVGGRVVVAAELDAGALARRLRRALGEIYGYPSDVHVLTPGG